MADCESSMKSAAAAAAAAVVDLHGEGAHEEDACSICLEPFSSQDPATVTCCRHEYHLQCILEWSQRSKECPICWQSLILKDPASQQLLEAVEIERNLRARRRHRPANAIRFSRTPPGDFEFDPVPPSDDESELDENIMQQLAAAAVARAQAQAHPHHLNRRQRFRSTGLDPSQVLVFTSLSPGSSAEQIFATASTEGLLVGNISPESNSPTPTIVNERYSQHLSLVHPSFANAVSITMENRESALQTPLRSQAREIPPRSPRRSRPSELFSFSESIKSKFSAASARYKESISKGTRGFKEKLLARNNSVKELSKEVHREVTAGVARMMERLDPASRRTGSSSSVSGCAEGTSSVSPDTKNVEDSLLIQSPSRIHSDASYGTHPSSSIRGCGTVASVHDRVEVTRLQDVLLRPEDSK